MKTDRVHWSGWLGGLVLVSALIHAAPLKAQPIQAANDGTGTVIHPQGQQFDIEGGTLSGDGANLFHSFQRLGLSEGQIANFLTHPNIRNILGRVVGGDVSYINGLIQVTGGTSNLYLMNPSGFIFGANASLNVSASFTATTATGIGFGTDAAGLPTQWFRAFGPNDYSGLIGTPSALNFSGFIALEPQIANNAPGLFQPPGLIINEATLTVSSGNDLTLVAGGVINTGNLSAPGGTITVLSIPSENIVRISQTGHLLTLEIPATSEEDNLLRAKAGILPLSLPALLTGASEEHAANVTVNSSGQVVLRGSHAEGGMSAVHLDANNTWVNGSGTVAEISTFPVMPLINHSSIVVESQPLHLANAQGAITFDSLAASHGSTFSLTPMAANAPMSVVFDTAITPGAAVPFVKGFGAVPFAAAESGGVMGMGTFTLAGGGLPMAMPPSDALIGPGMGLPPSPGGLPPNPMMAKLEPRNSPASSSPVHAALPPQLSNTTLAPLEQSRGNEFAQYFGKDLSTLSMMTAASPREALVEIARQTNYPSAILYVNALAHEIELVVFTASNQSVRKTVPSVSRQQLLATVAEFRNQITKPRNRNRQQYLAPAQQLYQWLIAPIEPELEAAQIKTLMLSLDAGLRTMPFAALHDGKQFLVEKYSLSMIPSINLVDTRYQPLKDTKVLAMGASEFPEMSPLPAVPVELKTITQKLWRGEAFLNQEFTRQNLIQQRRRYPYSIIHLATHGEFNTGEPNNSYIQFWDEKLRLDQLKQLGLSYPPVELLVLSACRTAVGDNNAELGFAGFAIAAGVKSALASLWSVSDEGTLALMTEFYTHLNHAQIKAEALRQAQISMLRGKVQITGDQLRGSATLNGVPLPPELVSEAATDFSHPYYWSGFTMIGSPW